LQANITVGEKEIDTFTDGDTIHLFVPHRWKPALHLTLKAGDIERLPNKADLAAAASLL
jgi:hypothetical protein